ncbi:angiopoietin-2-like [Lineus longissimus]|uniref:angiopoietin-2-like n=1 Tax=Lineus longissimus TaxID=88925 RepID=UPI00315D7487
MGSMPEYILVIFTMCIYFAYGQTSAHFRLVTEKDEAFEGGIEADIAVTSHIQCCLACLSKPGCAAVNFQYFSVGVNERKCVLLKNIDAVAGKKQRPGFGTFVAVSRLNQEKFSYCTSSDKGNNHNARITISGKDVPISCEDHWLVIQRRKDGSVDFEQDWAAYKQGFGSPTGELWLGNEYIHSLTRMYPCTLKVVVTVENGTEYWAQYKRFSIAAEARKYEMADAVYDNGTTGDFFTDTAVYGGALGVGFSTKDRDTNEACVKRYRGGWWYSNCYQANLNGVYGVECDKDKTYCIKIVPLQRYGLNIVKVVMKILPKLPL